MLTGRTVADLVRNMFVVAVMLAVGILVGFRPEAGVIGWAASIGLLLLLSFAFSWIGATVGLMIRSVEAVQSAGFIWLFPLTFASSAFVPTDSMPGWLKAFANHQPISLVVDAVRGFLLDQPVGSAGWQALAWCVGITRGLRAALGLSIPAHGGALAWAEAAARTRAGRCGLLDFAVI